MRRRSRMGRVLKWVGVVTCVCLVIAIPLSYGHIVTLRLDRSLIFVRVGFGDLIIRWTPGLAWSQVIGVEPKLLEFRRAYR